MATVILLRHGRSTANTGGVLAGRSLGVSLDEHGRAQAVAAAERVAGLRLSGVFSSPMERCQQTAAPILAGRDLELRVEEGLTECDYGSWTGQQIKDLLKEPLWRTVQQHPSAVTFPDGEAMAALAARAVATVRRIDAEVEQADGAGAVWVAVSHGDVIKAVLADALGMHLDLFQRLHIDPASISVIRYTEHRPFVLASNTAAGELTWLAAKPPVDEAPAGDAVVGGGAGAA
ncbi:MSMEG_4193 family putative phosphomutase [Nocardioides dubius]|uniref:Histidine phosphatase family protein n=1 Tax=Nocardioides dubius TaxID=317019 RepID=A0ABN1TRF1_9ACTN